MTDEDQGTLEITVRRPSGLAGLLRVLDVVLGARVDITIDADRMRRPLGTHRFPVTPGHHHVVMRYVPFEGFVTARFAGDVASVDVSQGEIVRIRYTTPIARHLAGRVEVERLPEARVVRHR